MWTSDTELLAIMADRLGVLASAHQLRSAPERVPRPKGLEAEAAVTTSPEQIAAFFGATV